MFIRLTVIMLLVANIAYVGWREYRGVATVSTQPADVDPLAGVPRLLLLREREAELAARADEPLAAAGDPGERRCFELGPFSNQADLRRAFNALAPFMETSRERQTIETQDRGFWVFLPAVESREDALRMARDLSAAGLRDYYVVTAGQQENTISLGLFRMEENARRRLEALQTLGFEAEIARRTEESRAYWLDYARGPEASPPWERVMAASPGVDHRAIPCFRAEG